MSVCVCVWKGGCRSRCSVKRFPLCEPLRREKSTATNSAASQPRSANSQSIRRRLKPFPLTPSCRGCQVSAPGFAVPPTRKYFARALKHNLGISLARFLNCASLQPEFTLKEFTSVPSGGRERETLCVCVCVCVVSNSSTW